MKPFAITRRGFALLLASALVAPGLASAKVSAAARSSASARSNRTASAMIRHSRQTRGHLTTRHIGQPRAFLKKRARADRRRTATAARAGVPVAKRPRTRKEFSTFKDERAAQKALARAIEANRGALRDMMRKKKKDAVLRVPVNSSAGVVYRTKSRTFHPPTQAVFPIQRVGNRLIAKTGYLTAQGARR
jgi:hypothetical protein